ncbi:esterase-like activity of phytase family protein [Chitinimonas sp. PSY-7]|uniref:esterase-like activity of phytase family protein n=1 Tax=Chitinimonas sp. PSY-7 TaxID=3459088 RepID=UPI00403FF98E
MSSADRYGLGRRIIAAIIGALGLAAHAADDGVASVVRYSLQLPAKEYLPYAGRFSSEFPKGLPASYGSGLYFKGYEKDGSLSFWTLTDRGPNTDSPMVRAGDRVLSSKVFLLPDFAPRVGVITVQRTGAAKLVSSFAIKHKGKPISGRPPGVGAGRAEGEIPLGDDLKPLASAVAGLDPEGLALDEIGDFWISDEYGPFIAQVDGKSGEVKQRYGPGARLPEILAQRQLNRGLEGIAVTPGGKVVAIMQSTLDIGKQTRNTAQFLRIVTLDPKSGATQMFAYPHDIQDYKKSGNAKIGDLVAIDETHFLLIEQGKARNKKLRHVVYLVDIGAAQDLTDLTLVNGKALEYGNADVLAKLEGAGEAATHKDQAKANRNTGLRMAKKTRLFDLRDIGWRAEKAEGLAVIGNAGKLADARELAVISDNDFGLKASMNGPDDDPEAYSIDEKGILFDSKDKRADVEFRISQGPERDTQLWLINLKKPLKDFFPSN